MATRPRNRTAAPPRQPGSRDDGSDPRAAPPPGQNDALIHEIDEALRTGQRLDLGRAFPNPPDEPEVPPVGATLQPDAEMRQFGRAEYYREFELRVVHEMEIRQLPAHTMADVLGKTITEIKRLQAMLKRRIRLEAQNIDFPLYIGRHLSRYRTMAAKAYTVFADERKPMALRIKFFQGALQASRDELSLMKEAGFFDHMKLTPKSGEQQESEREADAIATISRAFLDPSTTDEDVTALVTQYFGPRGGEEEDTDPDTDFIV